VVLGLIRRTPPTMQQVCFIADVAVLRGGAR
jgi:hypothetical protein